MNSKILHLFWTKYSFKFMSNFPSILKGYFTFFLFCLLISPAKTLSQPPNSIHHKPLNPGCGQGYWKNHIDLWNEQDDAVPFTISKTIEALGFPYSQDGTTQNLYKNVFGLSTIQMIAVKLDPDITLEQAINSGGGGLIKLLRQSVAALLNASATKFDFSPFQVLTLTHDAIINKYAEPLATQFEKANSGNCIFGIPPTCNLAGPTRTCLETNSLTYSANLDVADGPVTYQWVLINNTAGASLSGTTFGTTSSSPISINIVPAGSDFIPGGYFNLQLKLARSIYVETCYINSEISPGETVYIDGVVTPTCSNIILNCNNPSFNYNPSFAGATLQLKKGESFIALPHTFIETDAAGTYWLIATSLNGCKDSCSFILSKDFRPVASCSATPSVIDFCGLLTPEDQIIYCPDRINSPITSQLDVDLTGSNDTDPTHYTYLWSTDGFGSLSNLNIKNPVYTASLSDAGGIVNFSVTITNKITGCFSTSNCSVTVGAGGGKPINPNIAKRNDILEKDNISGNIEFVIYPNPNSGTIQIIFPNGTSEVDIDVVDISGKIIQRLYGIKTQAIQLKNIGKGIYLLRIISKNTGKQITKKIIIQ